MVQLKSMKHMSQYNYNEYEIEKAIVFLVNTLEDSGHNPKPVLLHSIRVASVLWNNGIPEKYVIVGILHDIIEDTDITKDDVAKEFGDEVSNMVTTLTLTKKNDAKESFEESLKDNNLAAVRAADLIENSNYYRRAGTDQLKNKLRNKYEYFMKCSEGKLPEPIYRELKKAHEDNVFTLI